MTTYQERRMDILQRRLRGRTQRDGRALPGFEQNVAALRAEMEQLSVRHAGNDEGENNG